MSRTIDEINKFLEGFRKPVAPQTYSDYLPGVDVKIGGVQYQLKMSGTLVPVSVVQTTPESTRAVTIPVTTVTGAVFSLDDEILERGRLLYVCWRLNVDAAIDHIIPIVFCDRRNAFPYYTEFANIRNWDVLTTSPGVAIGLWDAATSRYSIISTLEMPFRETLQVGFYNSEAGVAHGCGYSYVYSKEITT